MAFDQGDYDKPVSLFLGCLSDKDVAEMIALMSSSNVNFFIALEPMFIYYLQTQHFDKKQYTRSCMCDSGSLRIAGWLITFDCISKRLGD